VKQELDAISKKGQVRTRADVELGLMRPGGQLNIVEPNGRQLRSSVYMAQKRMIVTQAESVMGDGEALQFEQSVTLVNHAGTDLDRVVPQNQEPRTYDCR
jgi:hypothetical protein